jgi:outer membrane biosynthesis protein TonB
MSRDRGTEMKRALLLLMVLPAAACVSASAKAEVRPPPTVPAPPPRVIEPLPSTEAPSLEPVADLPAPPTPPSPRPRQQPPRDQAKVEPKPESKPETPPETTTAPAATATPVPPLRTGNTADGPEAVKQVREVMDRTNRMLGSIDYRNLGNERKANYDSARNFIKQAEEALKAGNTVFAKSLADNAERIAKELGGK